MSRPLFRFKGGIKLPGFKQSSTAQQIRELPVAPQLIYPLRQHIGEPAEPIVSLGEYVYKGQTIALGKSYVSAPVHASSSGVISAIKNHETPHPSQLMEPCIILDTDREDQWHPDIEQELHPEKLSPEELRNRIREAGVVGLGGAVFPSAVKLKPTREITTLVINGVECEPFITCDDMLMRTYPEDILRGVLTVNRIVNAYEIIIAIEDNKPEAFETVLESVSKFKAAGISTANSIEVIKVPTRFPAGGEKQLVKTLTGQDVPCNGLPYEVGVVCINVGTAAAVYKAVYEKSPLISRIVTVSGNNINNPGNFLVPVGTPMQFVIDHAGGTKQEAFKLIMGGPMMGFAINSTSAPVVKATNNLLLDYTEQSSPAPMPCIRCGSCADSCPMHLMPQQLYWHVKAKSYNHLERYHINDCIECGCCAIVCPSHIPLVQYFRNGKTEIKHRERQHKKAEISRIRNEQRQARLERIAQEKAEQKSKRGLRRRKPTSGRVKQGSNNEAPVVTATPLEDTNMLKKSPNGSTNSEEKPLQASEG